MLHRTFGGLDRKSLESAITHQAEQVLRAEAAPETVLFSPKTEENKKNSVVGSAAVGIGGRRANSDRPNKLMRKEWIR